MFNPNDDKINIQNNSAGLKENKQLHNNHSIIIRKNEETLKNPQKNKCVKIDKSVHINLYCGKNITSNVSTDPKNPGSKEIQANNQPCNPGLETDAQPFYFAKDAPLADLYVVYTINYS